MAPPPGNYYIKNKKTKRFLNGYGNDGTNSTVWAKTAADGLNNTFVSWVSNVLLSAFILF